MNAWKHMLSLVTHANKKWKTALILLPLLCAGAFLVAQLAGIGDVPPSQYVPKGALVYIETPNLRELLEWWQQSEWKAGWEKSKNYEYFHNSRLYLKLHDRITEYGSAAGFGFTIENITKVSGTQSALALYDIGSLKAVAMTRAPLEEAQTTELWAARQNFVEKKAGSASYYVEPQGGALAFAYSKPYFVVATDEGLLEQTLQAMQGAKTAQPLEQWDKWRQFDGARKQLVLPTGEVSILRLFLDQEALNRNRYFKRYWIHNNAKQLEPVKAAWIDLSLSRNAITEHRYFALADKQVTAESSAAVRALVKQLSAVRHDFLAFQASPDAAAVASRIAGFLNMLPQDQKESLYPAGYSGSYERAQEAAAKDVFRERIDEPILAPSNMKIVSADQPDTIARLLEAAHVQNELRLSYALWDDKAMFVRFIQTQAISLQKPEMLDQRAFLDALREYAAILGSVHLAEAGSWRQTGDGTYTLDWINPVVVRFQKPWVLVSNSEADLKGLAGALPADGAAGIAAGSYRELNWENSRWKYSRLMERLDYDAYHGDQPLFFSENVNSLLWALAPINHSSVDDAGGSEVVTYDLGKGK